MEYQLFERHLSPSTIQLSLGKEQANTDSVLLSVSKEFLSNYQIQKIVPQPTEVIISRDSYQYKFAAQMPGGNTKISFYLQPEKVGLHTGFFQLKKSEKIEITQFIYP